MSYGLMLLTLVVCFVVLLILYNIKDFDDSDKAAAVAAMPGGSQSEMHKRDCDVETVYSVNDTQCRAVCKEPGSFRSHNGACVNVLAFTTDNVVNKCDPKRGVLAFLFGDPQFGNTTVRCYSVDPGIQPDDPEGENIICSHGTIDIDYVKAFPQPSHCRCTDPARPVLALVANTKQVRRYGVCVSEKMEPVYRHNGLLYDGSAV